MAVSHNLPIIPTTDSHYLRKEDAEIHRVYLNSQEGEREVDDFYATEDEKALLKKLFAENKMDLNAVHSGVHTSWASSEQLVREMYFGCREVKERYGISPECVFYVDNQCVTLSHRK